MFCFSTANAQEQAFPFMDHRLPINERLDDLVGRLTLKEKVDQLMYTAPAIDHLGIPRI
jgi:beta-glucosidase